MTTPFTFVGWGPFAPGLSGAALAARLERLGPVVHAQGWAYADLSAAIGLAAASPRSLAGLPTRLDALPDEAKSAIRAAYGA